MPDKFIRHGAAVDGDGTSSALAQSGTVTFDTGTDVVTWTGHPLNDGDSVYFTTTGVLPTGLTANTRYFVRDKTTNTFKVAATAGGAAIDLTGTPSGTHTGITSGAWNNINIFEGTTPTRGAIAAGDVVYIRSKNASDADITITMTATVNFGSTAATASVPVTWVIDNGQVWSGVDGTIKYTHSTSNLWRWSLRANNHIIAQRRQALVWEHVFAAGVNSQMVELGSGSRTSGVLIDWWAKTGTATQQIQLGINCSLERSLVRCQRVSTSGLFMQGVYGLFTSRDTDYEVGVAAGCLVSLAASTPIAAQFIGGRLFGTGATTGFALYGSQAGTTQADYYFLGFEYPNTVAVNTQIFRSSRVVAQGMDDGIGALHAAPWGTAESRNDGNYPTLNASLPNSINKGWSWKLWPRYVVAAEVGTWLSHTVSKLYSQSPAAKTVTLELLLADTLSGFDKSTLWMEVSYIDNATGLRVVESTEALTASPLDTSTATWSATTYGATSLLKRKLSLTTAGSIKQDTLVMVTLRGTANAVAGDTVDILFMCPDPQLT